MPAAKVIGKCFKNAASKRVLIILNPSIAYGGRIDGHLAGDLRCLTFFFSETCSSPRSRDPFYTTGVHRLIVWVAGRLVSRAARVGGCVLDTLAVFFSSSWTCRQPGFRFVGAPRNKTGPAPGTGPEKLTKNPLADRTARQKKGTRKEAETVLRQTPI